MNPIICIAGPLRVLMVAFTPLSWLFLRLMKPFRKKEESDEQPTITEQELMYMQMTEDDGRDKNLQNATNAALQMFLDYLKALEEPSEEDI